MCVGNPQGGDADISVADQEKSVVGGSSFDANYTSSMGRRLLPASGKTTSPSRSDNCEAFDALPPLPTAPPDYAIPNCLPNPMDPDENDIGPYPVEETPAKLPRQQVRARARKRKWGNDDNNATFMNDAGAGHLPAHVENDIADLGKLISLMQPGDIARAHEFGPTLEEYAVHGVPVDCGG